MRARMTTIQVFTVQNGRAAVLLEEQEVKKFSECIEYRLNHNYMGVNMTSHFIHIAVFLFAFVK